VGADGSRIAQVRFDPDALDAAYAELDARYAAGEATEHPDALRVGQAIQRATAAGDSATLASLIAPDLVLADHRVLGWGTLRSRDEFLAVMRSRFDLRPDSRLRVSHVVLGERAWLSARCWTGSEVEGAYETPVIDVAALGADGRIARMDVYEPAQLPAARARFAELAAAPRDPLAALVKPNAATAAVDRVWAAVEAGDWEALRSLFAPGKVEDRRRQVLLSLDLDQAIADLPDARARGLRPQRKLVVTGGHRIAAQPVPPP